MSLFLTAIRVVKKLVGTWYTPETTIFILDEDLRKKLEESTPRELLNQHTQKSIIDNKYVIQVGESDEEMCEQTPPNLPESNSEE